jgi:hypothetical protein
VCQLAEERRRNKCFGDSPCLSFGSDCVNKGGFMYRDCAICFNKDHWEWMLSELRWIWKGSIGVVVHLASEEPGYIGTSTHPGEI